MKTRFRSAVLLALIQTAFILLLAAPKTVEAASWVTNGPMVTARQSHTLSLLPNGKVLAVGGLGFGHSRHERGHLVRFLLLWESEQ